MVFNNGDYFTIMSKKMRKIVFFFSLAVSHWKLLLCNLGHLFSFLYPLVSRVPPLLSKNFEKSQEGDPAPQG